MPIVLCFSGVWPTAYFFLSSAHHAAVAAAADYMPISGLSESHRVSLGGAQRSFEQGVICPACLNPINRVLMWLDGQISIETAQLPFFPEKKIKEI